MNADFSSGSFSLRLLPGCVPSMRGNVGARPHPSVSRLATRLGRHVPGTCECAPVWGSGPVLPCGEALHQLGRHAYYAGIMQGRCSESASLTRPVGSCIDARKCRREGKRHDQLLCVCNAWRVDIPMANRLRRPLDSGVRRPVVSCVHKRHARTPSTRVGEGVPTRLFAPMSEGLAKRVAMQYARRVSRDHASCDNKRIDAGIGTPVGGRHARVHTKRRPTRLVKTLMTRQAMRLGRHIDMCLDMRLAMRWAIRVGTRIGTHIDTGRQTAVGRPQASSYLCGRAMRKARGRAARHVKCNGQPLGTRDGKR